MADSRNVEVQLRGTLSLRRRPVAVAFLETPLPAALDAGVTARTGCVGNRVYTDLGDDELYVAIPGRDLVKLAADAQTVAAANAALFDYHSARRRALAAE